MMEIQFELEDETSFLKYLQYACLRCQGKIISLWIGTSQPSFISFEIIMAYVSATFVRFATSPVDGTNPANKLSLALYPSIYHGFYISQVAVSNFFHQQ